MKYILAIALCSLTFTACNNNKKYCWKCDLTYSIPVDSSFPASSTKTNMDAFCHKTKDEIKLIEGKGFESGNPAYSLQSFSNCTKK